MPKIRAKRCPLPAGCDCREFVMRALTNEDSIEAGIWADKRGSNALSDKGKAGIELMEAMRLSLVSVDGQPVNQNGVPYVDFDKWSQRTMTFALTAYQELNGVEEDEMEKFKRACQNVDLETMTGAPEDHDPTSDVPNAE